MVAPAPAPEAVAKVTTAGGLSAADALAAVEKLINDGFPGLRRAGRSRVGVGGRNERANEQSAASNPAAGDSDYDAVDKILGDVIAGAERDAEETSRIIAGSSSVQAAEQTEKIRDEDSAMDIDQDLSGKDTGNEPAQAQIPSLIVKLPVSPPKEASFEGEQGDIPSLIVKLPVSSTADTIKVSDKRS